MQISQRPNAIATERRIRVLIAKAGLDGHDRGAKVVSRALRDAGMEVIYTGLRQSIDQIVFSAIQEDVDAIGLSVLSGAHMHLFQELIKELKNQEGRDILVFGGGIIPSEDLPLLSEIGVSAVFQPGTHTQEIVKFIRTNVRTA